MREQSYWTPIGIASGSPSALLNEDGLLEVDRGSFSLEPFLFVAGRLVTWADVEISQELRDAWLPIPSSVWRAEGFVLTTTAFAADTPDGPSLYVRYRIENTSDATCAARFFCALRPYQVTPPWQAFRGMGGASPIGELRWHAGAVWIDERKAVIPLDTPGVFGAAAFEQGGVARRLERGELPPRSSVSDAFRHASGALRFDLDLAAGAARELHLAVPFGTHDTGERRLRRAATDRRRGAARERGGGVGATARSASRSASATATHPSVEALRTAAAHILINRDGPALQPGPRRYTRSWIRDGATMGAALLRMGCADEVRDFLRWYAPYQKADGNVPCAVDREGPDWLPEHDSHGQLAFLVAEYFRFTRDRELLAELWPAVLRAIDYLESLRSQRLAAEFASGDRKACYGLLPESVSHEGYLAQPVHAYWDDFWALRGIGDAASLARVLGDAAQERRLAALRDELGSCLYASIETTIAQRGLAYVPGSVEWADFDVTATATALTTTDAAERLPSAALAFSYDEYLARLPQTPRRRDRLEQLHRLRDPQSRRAGAARPRGRGARAARLLPRRPAPARMEPVARDLLARSAQPRSSGRRAAHLDRRRVGARGAESVRVRASDERVAGAGGRHPPRVARRRGGDRDREPADLVRAALLHARKNRVTIACASPCPATSRRRPAASSCARRCPDRSRASPSMDETVMDFDATSVKLDRRAANVTLHY